MSKHDEEEEVWAMTGDFTGVKFKRPPLLCLIPKKAETLTDHHSKRIKKLNNEQRHKKSIIPIWTTPTAPSLPLSLSLPFSLPFAFRLRHAHTTDSQRAGSDDDLTCKSSNFPRIKYSRMTFPADAINDTAKLFPLFIFFPKSLVDGLYYISIAYVIYLFN